MKFVKHSIPLVLLISLTSCASIVSDSTYPVRITSIPDQANFIITNKAGVAVQSGKTPSIVSLKSGAGYFKGEQYSINYSKEGYGSQINSIDSSLNGWYWGNLLFGGFVGMLIVDPATGAMWKLPESTAVSLSKEK